MRFTGRGVVMGASLSALVLVASGCAGAQEEEPTPSFASSTADAEPSPELTEPPYETELNLTPDEKKAADEAYDLMVRFRKADSRVAKAPGQSPEDSLQYLDGKMLEDYEQGYAEMAKAGERSVGVIRHRYYDLTDVSLHAGGGEDGSVEFSSCQDYTDFDIVDESGESMKADGVVERPVVYKLTANDKVWKIIESDYVDGECD